MFVHDKWFSWSNWQINAEAHLSVEYIFGRTLCTSANDRRFCSVRFFFRLICLLKTLLSHMHFIKWPFILAFFIDAYRFRLVWMVSISKQIESQLTGLTIRKIKINVPYENGQINVSPTNTGLKLSWSFYTNNNYYNHHRCVCTAHLPVHLHLG